MPFVEHPMLSHPKNSQILWRYMNLQKFEWLIQNKALYFPWLNKLDKYDNWEGLPSPLNFEHNRKVTARYVKGMNNPLRIMKLNEIFNRPGEIEEQKQKNILLKRSFFVNCWHMNDVESDSQWKLYGAVSGSIAIVSSFSRLTSAVIDSRVINGSVVTYYDPRYETTPEGNVFFLVTHKRKSYEHEKEFRLIHFNLDLIKSSEQPADTNITIDLEKLIEKIVISPRAPKSFIEQVEKILSKYEFSFECKESELSKSW